MKSKILLTVFLLLSVLLELFLQVIYLMRYNI